MLGSGKLDTTLETDLNNEDTERSGCDDRVKGTFSWWGTYLIKTTIPVSFKDSYFVIVDNIGTVDDEKTILLLIKDLEIPGSITIAKGEVPSTTGDPLGVPYTYYMPLLSHRKLVKKGLEYLKQISNEVYVCASCSPVIILDV